MPKKTKKELREEEKTRSETRELNFKLDNEQISAISEMEDATMILLTGKYGTGKTMTAVYFALKKLLKGSINKIYISRSAVCDKDEELGFVPGDINEKMAPLIYPIIANMYRCLPSTFVDYLMRTKAIEIVPVQYLKGVTYQEKSIAILDEIQNLSVSQMKNVISRIGNDSKLILVGDKAQMDIKESKSGYSLISKFNDEEFKIIELTNNHRHPIVERFTKYIEDNTK